MLEEYASGEFIFLVHRILLTRIMNKSCLIDTFSHISRGRLARRGMLTSVLWIAVGSMLGGTQSPAFGQDDAKPAAKPAYPLAVATSGADIYTVDLDLPGVWKTSDATTCLREVPNCCGNR